MHRGGLGSSMSSAFWFGSWLGFRLMAEPKEILSTNKIENKNEKQNQKRLASVQRTVPKERCQGYGQIPLLGLWKWFRGRTALYGFNTWWLWPNHDSHHYNLFPIEMPEMRELGNHSKDHSNFSCTMYRGITTFSCTASGLMVSTGNAAEDWREWKVKVFFLSLPPQIKQTPWRNFSPVYSLY